LRTPRFHIRTLMLVVAGIALLMGGAIEWSNYQKWAGEDEYERYCRESEAVSDREATDCRLKDATQVPYAGFAARQQALWGGAGAVLPPPYVPPPGKKAPASWLDEASVHADQAMRWRRDAIEHHRMKLVYQRPWYPNPRAVRVIGTVVVILAILFGSDRGVKAVVRLALGRPKRARSSSNPPPLV
jgi:hypothetical protein